MEKKVKKVGPRKKVDASLELGERAYKVLCDEVKDGEQERRQKKKDRGKEVEAMGEKTEEGRIEKTDDRIGKRRKTRCGVPPTQYAAESPRSHLQQMKGDFEIWLDRNLPTEKPEAIKYINMVKAMSLEDCMVQFATIVAPLRAWNGPHYCAQQVYDVCKMDKVKDVTEKQHEMLVWFIDHLCDAAIALK